MKCFAVLIAACLVVATRYVSANNVLIKSMSTSCQKQENASDQDVDDLSNGIAPNTPEGKCLAACMGKQFNLVNFYNIIFLENSPLFFQIKDGKIYTDGFMSVISMKFSDEKNQSKARKIAKACKEVTDAERCENAFKIWGCIDKQAKIQKLLLF